MLPLEHTMAPTRILVVEDEPKVAKALTEGLEADGFTVRTALNGEVSS